jgi:hypothetical protein
MGSMTLRNLEFFSLYPGISNSYTQIRVILELSDPYLCIIYAGKCVTYEIKDLQLHHACNCYTTAG